MLLASEILALRLQLINRETTRHNRKPSVTSRFVVDPGMHRALTYCVPHRPDFPFKRNESHLSGRLNRPSAVPASIRRACPPENTLTGSSDTYQRCQFHTRRVPSKQFVEAKREGESGGGRRRKRKKEEERSQRGDRQLSASKRERNLLEGRISFSVREVRGGG